MIKRGAFPLFVLVLAIFAGCPSVSIDEGPGGTVDDGGPRYADALISLLIKGKLTTCVLQDAGTVRSNLPNCNTGVGQGGACGASPALGPPKATGVALSADDVLEVGFICGGFITAHPDAGDLTIWGVAIDGGTGIVEASQDGSTFYELGILVIEPQTFSLARVGLDQAQFVRVSGRGGILSVDSVEAL